MSLGDDLLRQFRAVSGFRGLAPDPFGTSAGAACSLGKRTIIYGRNGSGKSTFSELLRQLGDKKVSRAEVPTSYWDGTITRSGALPDAVVDAIHVYNRFYVEEALRVFLDGQGSSAGILKLGSQNVKAEAKLRETREDLTRVKDRLSLVGKKRTDLLRASTMAEEGVKKSVIQELSPVDGVVYNTQAFNVSKARALLRKESISELPVIDLHSQRELAKSDDLEPLPALPTFPIDFTDLAKLVNEVADRRVESEVIEALRAEPVVARWIEEGTEIHRPGEICRFCESGTVTEQQLQRYARHFDASLTKLRSDLEGTKAALKTATANLEDWRGELCSENKVLLSERSDYQSELKKVDTHLVDSTDWIERALRVIESRASKILETVDVPDDVRTVPHGFDAMALANVIQSNNTACRLQSVHRNQARKSLEEHCAAAQQSDYATAIFRAQIADRALAVIKRRITDLEQEERDLMASQQDTGHMATLLNEGLCNHFGHAHLTITVSNDNKGYHVVRAAGPATDLSEGERNSIALLYFLRSLEADDVTVGNDLIVIDDPVTSLDKEALFAAHAIIDERTQNFGQVIILTHDFEYFRLNLTTYRSAFGKSQKKIREGNSGEQIFPAIQFLEVFARAQTPAAERQSSLRQLSARLLTHPSEYHYLFWRISCALCEQEDAELPLLGNAGRRLLEGFISFKAPNGGDFQQKIEMTAKTADASAELMQRIVRFAHGASHRGEPNLTVSLDFPSIKEELVELLRFIQICDSDHFDRMCKAVEVDLSDALQ